MYADRVDAQANLSIKERLNGNSAAGSVHRRPTSGKRQREDDDKWEHDLFEENGPRVSNRRVGSNDLRLKLQRKTIEKAKRSVRGPVSGGARDLRDKLSGALYSPSIEFQAQPFRTKTVSRGARDLRDKLSGALYSHPIEIQPQSVRTMSASEASKPPRRSVETEAPGRETKKIARSVSKKKTQQKVETVDSFLQSLGLEKYAITFQAEEVDMTALVHMGVEDLKAMGVPMGPRKKILSALESKV